METVEKAKVLATGTDFSNALAMIKHGRHVTRQCWDANTYVAMHIPALLMGDEKMSMPYLYMSMGRHAIPWLPAQSDLLADDWVY